MKTLTNIRTHVQFSQYGKVVELEYVGNKLQAMNVIRLNYGVKSFSALHEYKTTGYLIKGTILKK